MFKMRRGRNPSCAPAGRQGTLDLRGRRVRRATARARSPTPRTRPTPNPSAMGRAIWMGVPSSATLRTGRGREERKFETQGEEEQVDADLGQEFHAVHIRHGHAARVGTDEDTGDDLGDHQGLLESVGHHPHQGCGDHGDDVGGHAHSGPPRRRSVRARDSDGSSIVERRSRLAQ